MTGINWRDAKTNPPTESDATYAGVVIHFSDSDEDGIKYRYYRDCKEGLWVPMSEFKAHIKSTLNPVQPDGSGGCETIRGLRNYSFDPPTKSDANSEGKVVLFWKDGSCGSWAWDKSWSADKPVFWCRSDEFHRIKESLLRIATSRTESTLNPPDSQWVYASERWPTDLDGQHVLWMADSWSQPGVHPVCAFSQASHCYRHNLRWMRIPPCPPPPKRKLPAKPVGINDLPVRVVLRSGENCQAFRFLNNGALQVRLCDANGNELNQVWNTNGKADSGRDCDDIIYVDGWLTAEELEALKNGI